MVGRISFKNLKISDQTQSLSGKYFYFDFLHSYKNSKSPKKLLQAFVINVDVTKLSGKISNTQMTDFSVKLIPKNKPQ
jgi:hypothetical protein